MLTDRLEFKHDYDFGTTTRLTLRVLGMVKVPLPAHEIRIVARNDAPEMLCECGQPATWVCTECYWDDEGLLCDKCAEDHECGEECLLPVVNSPRCGVCGYCGPEAA